MFASSLSSRTRRRGVVLILILGMLGLLALIGVTFATFSNQAQINARNFSQAASFPDPSEMMDFALAQLIDDTANPQSVIRGHSLKRDMYGSDATANGSLLNGAPNGAPMVVNSATLITTGNFAGLLQLTTNIPSNTAAGGSMFYGYNFTRWIIRFPALISSPNYFVASTSEILVDDATGSVSPNRLFYIALPSLTAAGGTTINSMPPADPAITNYTSPEFGGGTTTLSSTLNNPVFSALNGLSFQLDGRFLKAFNGPGLAGMNAYTPSLPIVSNAVVNALGTLTGNLDTALLQNANPQFPPQSARPLAEYGNFRNNGNIFNNVLLQYQAIQTGNTPPAGTFTPGLGDPNTIPVAMDEDYDACDLENWFLAMQSADGQVIIPSFHRPGIVTANDWKNTLSTTGGDPGAQLTYTRSVSRILRPRQIDGHSSIAFPDLTPDGNSGRITYDVDNDGDGLTDSVWLDLGYPPKRSPEGQLFKPLFSFMVIGLNGRIPLNTAGNIQDRDNNLNPLYDHTEHLGVSPSEIDMEYALQNAYQSGYDPTVLSPNGTTPWPIGLQGTYQQYDNAGITSPYDLGLSVPGSGMPPYQFGAAVSVATTQERNILTGTRAADPRNNDLNQVVVNGQQVTLPNNYADAGDAGFVSGQPSVVNRTNPPVSGRWGESDFVPGPASNPLISYYNGTYNVMVFNNPIRAGFSVDSTGGYLIGNTGVSIPGGSWEPRDDNSNTYDWYPLNPVNSIYPEMLDYYDAAGALALPVERIRRFVTPIDVDGNGRVISFGGYNPNNQSTSANNPRGLRQNGADVWGRVNFYGYFRPPGIPMVTANAFASETTNGNPAPFDTPIAFYTPAPLNLANASGNTGAVWYDTTGTPLANPPIYPRWDARTNNPYHAYGMALSPDYKNSVATGVTLTSALALSGMPSDIYSAQQNLGNVTPSTITTTTGVSPPTFTTYNASTTPINPGINSNSWDGGLLSAVNWGSSAMNEADEMNVYTTNRLDQPFGAGDLEWLYRYQDVDGASLVSRLQYLAPISFLNPKDGFRRRRLFSTDTWEPTNFVWANDNPQGVFPTNSRFGSNASASFQNLNNALTQNVKPNPDPGTDFSVAGSNSSAGWPSNFGLTPAIAQRDRRINLNFPLPVSNSPYEPIRQKWIRETYQLLKAVLPPRSVDTPEELAQLSQYVVNMIDFRDPDATMTRFVNTDVWVTEPAFTPPSTLTTQQATLSFSSGTNPPNAPNPPATPAEVPTHAYDPGYTLAIPNPLSVGTAGHYLIQYGMEYQPVAINEVLAYQFQSHFTTNAASATGSPTNNDARMQVELVNMLTKDAIGGNYPDSSDLDLAGWDLVVLPDDAYGRPDPYTGQIPLGPQPGLFMPPTPATPPPTPLTPPGQSYPSVSIAGGSLALLSGQAMPTPPLPAASTYTQPIPAPAHPPQFYYYVLGDEPLAQAAATPPTSGTDIQSSGIIPSTANTNTGTTNPIPITPALQVKGWKQPNPTFAYFQNTVPTAIGELSTSFGYVDLTGMLYQRSTTAAASTTPPSATSATLPLNPGYYYWVYLRRPANPFDPTSDKVVVDSFRFVFHGSRGVGYTSGGDKVADLFTPSGTPAFNPASEYIFSLQRLQPYRGGHAVPPLQPQGATTGVYTTTTFIPAYGYSEQAAACQISSIGGTFPDTNTPLTSSNIYVTPPGATPPLAGATGTPMVELTTANLIPPMSALLAINSTAGNGTGAVAADNPNGKGAINTGGASYLYSTAGMYGTTPPALGPNNTVTGSQSTGAIFHTIGSQNLPSDNSRDYLMFNDRDYMSVVELLMVPSCSPGLFTKQFAEVPPPIAPSYQGVQALAYPIPTTLAAAATGAPSATYSTAPTTMGPLRTYAAVLPTYPNPMAAGTPAAPVPFQGWGLGGGGNTSGNQPEPSPWPQDVTRGSPWTFPVQLTGNGPPHPFPYLNDEFFYTGYSAPLTGQWIANQTLNTAATAVYYRSATADNNGVFNDIGGPSGAGYHKMLDFFEVPSSATGAISEVSGGINYDWARQDLRPGLLNINLIIDEEVFLGLMGPQHYGINNHGQNGTMNQGQIGMLLSSSYAQAVPPKVVTQGTDGGVFANGYSMPNVGIWDPNGFQDPIDGNNYPNTMSATNLTGGANTSNALMKACFYDFLSLRGNAKGHVFSFRNEKPFHSLSYPDINYTVLRPATLVPTATLPAPPPGKTNAAWAALTTPTTGNWLTTMQQDPAFKNPYLFTITSPIQPPPIPPRRLFQIADAYGSPDGSTVIAGTQPSNASVLGDSNVNVLQPIYYVGSPNNVNLPGALAILNAGAYQAASTIAGGPLTQFFAYPDLTATPFNNTTTGYNVKDYLGGQFTTYVAAAPGPPVVPAHYSWPNPSQTNPVNVDQTDHPYFRTEWLQKVTNLTTVRTHQYAVWITVGFFEVTQAGDPTLATTNPLLAYDVLGNELGYLDGRNVRYRGFFLIDRTKAVGFNPFAPDDFHACVTYRQLIE